jgi:hypothetical protein
MAVGILALKNYIEGNQNQAVISNANTSTNANVNLSNPATAAIQIYQQVRRLR